MTGKLFCLNIDKTEFEYYEELTGNMGLGVDIEDIASFALHHVTGNSHYIEYIWWIEERLAEHCPPDNLIEARKLLDEIYFQYVRYFEGYPLLNTISCSAVSLDFCPVSYDLYLEVS